MKKENTMLILGGDKRQRFLFDILRKNGYKVIHIEKNDENSVGDLIEHSSVIIFPVPVTKDKVNIYSDNPKFTLAVDKAINRINQDSVVFGGGFNKAQTEYFESENIEYHDVLKSELFAIENAYFTAQGAVRLLLENTDEYLKDKSVLVTGFGRISVALSELLKKLQMKVYVAARNEIQLKYAEKLGCVPLRLNNCSNLGEYDFIFNTIPNRIFNKEIISTVKDTAVFFELASYPFGADKKDFEYFNLKYVMASALPGRFLPLSSAYLLKEYIEQFV